MTTGRPDFTDWLVSTAAACVFFAVGYAVAATNSNAEIERAVLLAKRAGEAMAACGLQ